MKDPENSVPPFEDPVPLQYEAVVEPLFEGAKRVSIRRLKARNVALTYIISTRSRLRFISKLPWLSESVA